VNSRPFLYINIRVPKSASTTTEAMITQAFPEAKSSLMLSEAYGERRSAIEILRNFKRLHRPLYKRFKCFTLKQAWEKIDRTANSGDIVSGHLSIDDIRIQNFDLKIATIVRHPVYRLLSSYNDLRNGYLKRNSIRRLYQRGTLGAAGRYSFKGYVQYLKEHQPKFMRLACHYVLGDKEVKDPLAFLKENYFCFGTVEKLDLYIKEFSEKVGVTLKESFKNQTPHKSRKDLTSEELSFAEQYCSEDMELYEIVDQHLESRASG